MTMAAESPKALIEEGQALVHSLATKIARNLPIRVDLDDLIAYGQVGLAEAARQFDPSRGTQFTTFAYYRIRGAIFDGVSKMSWTSRARYARYRAEEMTNETLAEAHESNPADLPLAEEARWFRNVTEKLAVIHLVSVSDDGETGLRASAIEDPGMSPAASAAGRELNKKLHELVDKLPGPERRLIRTVYFEGATLQEAANRLGISKSWASRLHAKTLEELARLLRKIGAD